MMVSALLAILFFATVPVGGGYNSSVIGYR